MEEGQE